jgi:hypothetical protein
MISREICESVERWARVYGGVVRMGTVGTGGIVGKTGVLVLVVMVGGVVLLGVVTPVGVLEMS